MKSYIEQRAIEIGNYIVENGATVRQTAKKFGVSKSTVHTDVIKENASLSVTRGSDKGRKFFTLYRNNDIIMP